MQVNYSDLEQKGFCVVKSLFTNEALTKIQADFDAINSSSDLADQRKAHFVDAVFLPASKKIDIRAEINQALTPLMSDISANSFVKTNFIIPSSIYFAIDQGVDLKWHQDHESYYQAHDHINYLNVYVAVKKPDPKQTGLSVIDFTKLFDRSPELEFLRGYGATTYFVEGNKTVISDDNNDQKITLDYSLDDIADHPVLEEGDALILRGDCIHKTQDTNTSRVSLSIRCVNLDSIVRKSYFEPTSEFKKILFTNMRDKLEQVLSKFKDSEEITLKELLN